MDTEEKIKECVKCCACGESLSTSRYINTICLDKKATWRYNTWGNVLIPGSEGRAVAIVCDECIEQKREPEYAVEWDNDMTEVRYHLISDLEDVPEILSEEVASAERLLSKAF